MSTIVLILKILGRCSIASHQRGRLTLINNNSTIRSCSSSHHPKSHHGYHARLPSIAAAQPPRTQVYHRPFNGCSILRRKLALLFGCQDLSDKPTLNKDSTTT